MQAVVFLSDFGITDIYVGIVKGVVKSNCNVDIIDLAHSIDAYNLKSAQFILKYSYQYFPQNSIFLVVVDPQVGSNIKPIVVKRDSYTFVGRDNGILTFGDAFEVYEIDEDFDNVSYTFHGRDIFAKVVCKIVNNNINLRKTYTYNKFNIKEVEFSGKEQKGEVLWIDKFGNIITNIKPSLQVYELIINGVRITKKARFYAEYKDGLFSIDGSFGFIEIANYMGSAARLINAKISDEVTIRSRQ